MRFKMSLKFKLYYKRGEWIDEDGNLVITQVPYFSVLYADKISKELSKKYDITNERVGDQIPSSLGQTEEECFASDLLKICNMQKEIIGFSKEELKKHEEVHESIGGTIDFIDKKYLRIKKVMGTEVVFPTEKLLINQKVPKK